MANSRGRAVRDPGTAGGRGTEQAILDAAGKLFVRQGFCATSTRAIAELAGLQQASVYHYFSSKEAILLRLVLGTVLPSRRLAERLLAAEAPAHVTLWALSYADARLLLDDPQNLGALYLAPELTAEPFAEFHENRDALEAAYGQLVGRVLERPATPFEATIAMGLVENVILQRRRAHPLPPDAAERIADAVLRVAGLPEPLEEQDRLAALALAYDLRP